MKLVWLKRWSRSSMLVMMSVLFAVASVPLLSTTASAAPNYEGWIACSAIAQKYPSGYTYQNLSSDEQKVINACIDPSSQKKNAAGGSTASSIYRDSLGNTVCNFSQDGVATPVILTCLSPSTDQQRTDTVINLICSDELDYYGGGNDAYTQCKDAVTNAYNSCSFITLPTGTQYVAAADAARCIKSKVTTSQSVASIRSAIERGRETADTLIKNYKSSIADKNQNSCKAPQVWNEEKKACEDGDSTTCAITAGIGWVVCPIGWAASGFVGFMYSILEYFLAIPALSTTTGSGNSVYRAWVIMRNIANVVFVGVFLLIIYSQMVGGGRK